MAQCANIAVKSEICVSDHFRDVSSVELLMNNHQGIKAEIDARNDSFTTCIELGKSLLARKHYASEEVPCSLQTAMGSWGFSLRDKPALCHPHRNNDRCHLSVALLCVGKSGYSFSNSWWVTEVISRFKVSFSAQILQRLALGWEGVFLQQGWSSLS